MRCGGGQRSVLPSLAIAESACDFYVGLVLAESVDGPDGCGEPADEGDLQDEAEQAGQGAADEEEGEPREEEGDDESHGETDGSRSLEQKCTDLLTEKGDLSSHNYNDEGSRIKEKF